MEYHRGKISETIIGPRWRVKHRASHVTTTGLFDIVGGKDEDEAVAKVRAAYARERVIVSVERLD
jgi:hypothetical protein